MRYLRPPLLLFLLLSGTLWFLSSCKALEDSAMEKLNSTTLEEQEISFKPYSDTQINGEDIFFYIQDRVGLTFGGDEFEVELDEGSREAITMSGGAPELGSAIAIDPRGYFLTAAHCVEFKNVYVLYLEPRQMPTVKKARVVVNGESLAKDYVDSLSPEEKEKYSERHLDFDVAIIHIDSSLEKVFPWAKEFAYKEEVIGAGLKKEGENWNLGIKCFAGKLTHEGDYALGNLSWELIFHDSPARSGNSGGPLMNTEGELIGLNFGRYIHHFRQNRKYTKAIRPDLEWVNELIEKDYRENVVKQ